MSKYSFISPNFIIHLLCGISGRIRLLSTELISSWRSQTLNYHFHPMIANPDVWIRNAVHWITFVLQGYWWNQKLEGERGRKSESLCQRIVATPQTTGRQTLSQVDFLWDPISPRLSLHLASCHNGSGMTDAPNFGFPLWGWAFRRTASFYDIFEQNVHQKRRAPQPLSPTTWEVEPCKIALEFGMAWTRVWSH